MTQMSQNFSSFVILGGGQHAYLIHSLAAKQEINIIGWMDEAGLTRFKESSDFIHLIKDSDYLELSSKGVGLIPGIASHKLWAKRSDLLKRLIDSSNSTPNIFDTRALVSDKVQLGQGNQFLGNCFIQSFVQIGDWSIFNSGSIVEHDSIIGDYVHIAPGVTVCGGVTIGSGSYIGAGSTILEGVTIGENVLIGAGSLVIKDVESGVIQYGVPSSRRGRNYD